VYSYHSILPELAARGFRAVAIDMVGHGLSDKPATAASYTLDAMTASLDEALDRLQIVTATLVGHSMGGAIVARLAALRPTRVTRLVLAAPVGFGDALPLRLALLMTPRLLDPVLPYLVPRWTVPIVLRLAYGTRRPPDPRDCNEYWAPTQFPEFPRAMRTTLHAFDWRAGERSDHSGFGAIRAPTTLIYGEQDHFVVRRAARRYADVIPGIRVISLADCGHVIPEEAPEAVIDAVTAPGVTFSN
jgi:pimeloyl-ACP methyl ester carboxylesterase